MKNELNIKRCKSCGAMVKVLQDCTCDDCGIKCCGEEMETLVPNSVDASFEKHVPQVERVEDEIFVKVMHPMEKEHYIEWISMVKYVPNATVYAYCNKHGLWKKEI